MSGSTMLAAVARGAGKIDLARIALSEPGPGEVRVRIGACGLCGTDLHFFHAGLYAPGLTPGHEMAGEVDALGPGVSGVACGDQVAIEPLLSCGRCPACLAGRDSICREVRVLGLHVGGGFAEAVVVPARRVFPARGHRDARLVSLAEPAAVVVHGLRRGGLSRGQRVLVLGAGAIGLLALLAARRMGAGEVWISARHPQQAELARAFGADRALRADEATPERLDALGREAPIDLVVEAVGGGADTLRGAGAAVRPGGTVSVLGVFLGPLSLDPLPLLLKEATLAWSNCYEHSDRDADFAEALELLVEQSDTAAQLLTHAVALDDVKRAYALAARKGEGARKVSVLP